MATGVVTWSKNTASNATTDSAVSWPEGMAPSQVNDSARGEMASVAKWRDDTNGSLVTGGGTTAYTLTTNQTFAALTAGYQVAFQMNATNTGTSTLNVDGLGAKPLRTAAGVEVVAGDLLIGATYTATYFSSNSGEWILQDSALVRDGAVVASKIGTNAVTETKIQDAAVTLAKQANLATKRAIGRNTGSTGVPEAVTAEQILAWIGTPAQGDILYHNGTDMVRLAAGTAGYFLKTNGAGANPAWAPSGWGHVERQFTEGTGSITTAGSTTDYTYSSSTAPSITGNRNKSDDVTITRSASRIGAVQRFRYRAGGTHTNLSALALFIDSTAAAVDWCALVNSGRIEGEFFYTATDTASHTFKIAVFGAAGNTADFSRRTFTLEETP